MVLLGLSYDFVRCRGVLTVADGSCCDMQSCVDLFKAVDPAVRRIRTVASIGPNAQYFLRDGVWKVYPAPEIVRSSAHWPTGSGPDRRSPPPDTAA